MTSTDFDKLADLSSTAMPAIRRMWIAEALDGRIASFVASSDITDREVPPLIDAVTADKYGYINNLEASMMETYYRAAGYTLETIPYGHSAFLDIGGTLPEFARKGLNKTLYEQLLDDSKNQGYLYVGSLTYNKFTFAIAKAIPGVEILRVEYLTYWTDNKAKLDELRAAGNDKVALVRQKL